MTDVLAYGAISCFAIICFAVAAWAVFEQSSWWERAVLLSGDRRALAVV